MIEKLRAQQITIDLPTEEGEAWVHIVVQKVFKDKDTYQSRQVVDRVRHVYNSISEFATDMHTVIDPVTGKSVTISGAGIAELIRSFAHDWFGRKYDGQPNNQGDFILNA